MATSYTGSTAEECKVHGSGAKTMKRTYSNESMGGQVIKSCVCAPATHARSFKCRLHRVNSQGPQSAPLPPQPAVSGSSTRTVEAQ